MLGAPGGDDYLCLSKAPGGACADGEDGEVCEGRKIQGLTRGQEADALGRAAGKAGMLRSSIPEQQRLCLHRHHYWELHPS